MMTVDALQLHAELEASGLPVEGADATGRVQYSRELTPAEQTTAQAIIAAHDPTKREREERTALDAAQAAAADLKLYLDRTSPTQAQTVAALKLLIRVVLWLLRNELK